MCFQHLICKDTSNELVVSETLFRVKLVWLFDSNAYE
jgi:hypothetical protein